MITSGDLEKTPERGTGRRPCFGARLTRGAGFWLILLGVFVVWQEAGGVSGDNEGDRTLDEDSSVSGSGSWSGRSVINGRSLITGNDNRVIFVEGGEITRTPRAFPKIRTEILPYVKRRGVNIPA